VKLPDIMAVYLGSDGKATNALYAKLHERGPLGFIAVNLFRACKSSERAKLYRQHGFRSSAYDRKQWSIDNLTKALTAYADRLCIKWGWGVDEKQPMHNQVLYVELPEGQVSFHTGLRGKGPLFDGEWDGARGTAPQRVCRLAARVLGSEP
jgi:hypothetical protein